MPCGKARSAEVSWAGWTVARLSPSVLLGSISLPAAAFAAALSAVPEAALGAALALVLAAAWVVELVLSRQDDAK